MAEYPRLLHTAVDTTNARQIAEFYRKLLGLQYRPGDEPPADETPDDAGWLVLVDPKARASWRSSRSMPCRAPPGPRPVSPCSCTLTSLCRASVSCKDSVSGRRPLVQSSCLTGLTIPTSRSTSSLTWLVTPSASSWHNDVSARPREYQPTAVEVAAQ